MWRKSVCLIITTSILFLSFSIVEFNNQPPVANVVIKKEKGQYQLYRNGEPYFIKGAGGYKYYERLKACGGNSIRLWSTKGAKEYMDKAYELGLTVTLGLEMGHERKGFDYNDKKAV